MRSQDSLRYDRTLSEEQRTLTGSFYTPEPISKLMCALVISHKLSRQKQLNQPQLFDSLVNGSALTQKQFDMAAETVASWQLADLCAGTGAFPLAWLDLLANWHLKHCNSQSLCMSWIHTLAQRFVVIDIQAEPLKLYQDTLKTRYGICNTQLPVYCFDSLVDEAYPITVASEGFDIIMGNPPYLGEKSHKAVFQTLRAQPFGSRYYEGRMDYFYYFVYKALELLKPEGMLCYITTNYFTTADGAKKLRNFLKHNGSFISVVNFNDAILFKDAMGQHNATYIYEKNKSVSKVSLFYPKARTSSLEALKNSIINGYTNDKWQCESIESTRLYNESGHISLVPLDAHERVLEKISKTLSADGSLKNRLRLGEAFHVQQGIVSGFDKLKQQGVFVLSQAEIDANADLKPYLKAFYKNKQVRRYRVLKPAHHGILYLDGKEAHLPEVVEKHLMPYQERLLKRREVQKGIRPWYALQWPRESWRFEGPLIATPQRAFVNVFAYEPNDLYGSADIYYISPKNRHSWVKESTLFMTGYLNSLVVFYWLHLKGKRKGSMLELYASPLKEVPILDFYEQPEVYMPLVKKVEEMMQQLQNIPMDEAKTAALKEAQLALDAAYAMALGLSDEDLEHMSAYKHASGADKYEDSYWEVGTL